MGEKCCLPRDLVTPEFGFETQAVWYLLGPPLGKLYLQIYCVSFSFAYNCTCAGGKGLFASHLLWYASFLRGPLPSLPALGLPRIQQWEMLQKTDQLPTRPPEEEEHQQQQHISLSLGFLNTVKKSCSVGGNNCRECVWEWGQRSVNSLLVGQLLLVDQKNPPRIS